jgi:ABC-2 type transport system permease protein
MNALAQALPLTLRDLRALLRQPWYVAITLVQPVIWLLLFGALFKSVAEVPGFTGGSYIEFLARGS